MQLSWLLFLASLMPAPVHERACLAATIYLEARGQPTAGQIAVAEVALRRRDAGHWGQTVCAVVKSRKQFAPTLVAGDHPINCDRSWQKAWKIAGDSLAMWQRPPHDRTQVVPGADHFYAVNLVAPPAWASGDPVAVIGDHAFYRVGL
jgi:spore germination cell wall hydrolase CwlJ-like protein